MLLNTVYRCKKSDRYFRVVFEAIDLLWLIDLYDPNAWPHSINLQGFNELIESGSYTKGRGRTEFTRLTR